MYMCSSKEVVKICMVLSIIKKILKKDIFIFRCVQVSSSDHVHRNIYMRHTNTHSKI